MTRDEFLASIDELVGLRAGTLRGPERLDKLEQWTSVAVIGFSALVDKNNGLALSPRQIANCSTVSDLLTLAKVDA